MAHLDDVREALVSRGQDVHLLGHQGENQRYELNEGAWRTCPLDPCVSDRRLLYRPALNSDTLKPMPPLTSTFLQLVWASRLARWLDDVDKGRGERWALLRRWLDDRANRTA